MTQPARSLVLFDIDGTLMRGAGGHHKDALVEGIRKVTGQNTTLEGVATSGMLDRDLIVQMLRTAGVSRREIQGALQDIMTECQIAYERLCSLDLGPFVCGGARELLVELRAQGAALGLVTGNLSAIAWRKMELAGLRDYFAVGAFAEDGRTRTRLASVAARRASKQQRIRKNARISLIGDHANDVLAAKANQFQAVAVATGLMPFDELAALEPDILVHHLGEIDPLKLL